MDDLTLSAQLDDSSTLYVTPLARETLEQHANGADLGGLNGYFVVRTVEKGAGKCFEVLAKATSFEAAGQLFDLIVKSRRAPAA